MKNQFLPEIIKKITSRKKKIITSDEIKSLIESIMKADYQDTRAYKIIYYLKKK
jgi:surfactin synthase thioesterase subunit